MLVSGKQVEKVRFSEKTFGEIGQTSKQKTKVVAVMCTKTPIEPTTAPLSGKELR